MFIIATTNKSVVYEEKKKKTKLYITRLQEEFECGFSCIPLFLFMRGK